MKTPFPSEMAPGLVDCILDDIRRTADGVNKTVIFKPVHLIEDAFLVQAAFCVKMIYAMRYHHD